MASKKLDGKFDHDYEYIGLGNDVIVASISGAPVDGTSGSYAGVAGPGSLLTRYGASPKLYINTNTKASPTWTVVGAQT